MSLLSFNSKSFPVEGKQFFDWRNLMTEKFTRLALLAIVIMLAFISLLLYDRLVLLPQRVAKAASEEADRKAQVQNAESQALMQQAIKDANAIREADEFCKEHPENVARCSEYVRRHEKKP